MFSFAKAPQPLFKRMQDSFALYWASLSKVWYLAFILMLFSSLPSIHALLTGAPMAQSGKLPAHPATFTIFLIALIFVSTFITGLILHRIHEVGLGKATTLTASMHIVRQRWLKIVGAVIIIGCALIVVAAVGALILGLIPGIRGTILFLLPALYLMILFIYYLPLIVLRDVKVLESIEKSVRLVWKHWWDTFLVILPPIFAILIVQYISMQIDRTNVLAQVLINLIVVPILQPWFTAAILVQYEDALLVHKA